MYRPLLSVLAIRETMFIDGGEKTSSPSEITNMQPKSCQKPVHRPTMPKPTAYISVPPISEVVSRKRSGIRRWGTA